MNLPNLTDDLKVEDLDIGSIDDIEALLKRLGVLKSEIEDRQNEKARQVAQVERKHDPVIKRRQRRAKTISKALSLYLLAHQDEVLEGEEGKTVELINGTVSYSKGRSKLVYTDDKEAIIERLRALGEGDLVVIKETLHKKPLMKAWDRISGIEGMEMQEGQERVSVEARPA